MLVKCCVEVNNRFMPIHNSKVCAAKSSRGAIGLYKKSRTSETSQNSNENIFHVVLYTSRYKNGFKYRVSFALFCCYSVPIKSAPSFIELELTQFFYYLPLSLITLFILFKLVRILTVFAHLIEL